MSPRGPSRASKTKKAAFAKTLKNMQFLKVFGVQRPPKRALGGLRGLPRGTQRASEPNKKGIQKKTPKLANFRPVLGPFWGPFWDQIGPRRGEDGPKRATKSLKDLKSCIFKKCSFPIVKPYFLGSRGFPREPREAQEGPQEALKEPQNLDKKLSKK